MKISIIIPARGEEKNLGGRLDSIERAARDSPGQAEVIVVLNRCAPPPISFFTISSAESFMSQTPGFL